MRSLILVVLLTATTYGGHPYGTRHLGPYAALCGDTKAMGCYSALHSGRRHITAVRVPLRFRRPAVAVRRCVPVVPDAAWFHIRRQEAIRREALMRYTWNCPW